MQPCGKGRNHCQYQLQNDDSIHWRTRYCGQADLSDFCLGQSKSAVIIWAGFHPFNLLHGITYEIALIGSTTSGVTAMRYALNQGIKWVEGRQLLPPWVNLEGRFRKTGPSQALCNNLCLVSFKLLDVIENAVQLVQTRIVNNQLPFTLGIVLDGDSCSQPVT